jgi:hypothetical protein
MVKPPFGAWRSPGHTEGVVLVVVVGAVVVVGPATVVGGDVGGVNVTESFVKNALARTNWLTPLAAGAWNCTTTVPRL